MRFDNQGHFYYDPQPILNNEMRQVLLERELRSAQLRRPPSVHGQHAKHRGDRSVASSSNQTEHGPGGRLRGHIEDYSVEHKFPHIYTGWGVPTRMPVTAFGPHRGRPAYYSTSQDDFKW
eukprot:CAMPEP_0196585582 /NCGR_PEP_ID=MMETSP1081-20130531/51211_1 /TAXON_ID=36882 /ORGANISM="Pyramimonas amylifera, Strain CCMP720" /LENGTH=119 /DNA_ID=CAMNT_0041907179 /DNA_START=195 /DNA_END=551 /DNA_ORIENTATION=-